MTTSDRPDQRRTYLVTPFHKWKATRHNLAGGPAYYAVRCLKEGCGWISLTRHQDEKTAAAEGVKHVTQKRAARLAVKT